MGLELVSGTLPEPAPKAALRAAAVHVADRVATEHPHELDDLMPRLAGHLVGADPKVRAEVLELLDALGLQ